MEVLGYPLTYPTRCFINGGCGARVFAHTNGDGDFVLFDALGHPWPIHSCYLELLGDSEGHAPPSQAPDAYTNQEWAQQFARRQQAYSEAARQASRDPNRPPVRDIVKIAPASTQTPVRVCGQVQDIIEKRSVKLLSQAGSLAQQLAARALGSCRTQITIITSDFASYTAFADLEQTVLGRGSTVVAVLQPTYVLGLGAVFVACDLDVLPTRPTDIIRSSRTPKRGKL